MSKTASKRSPRKVRQAPGTRSNVKTIEAKDLDRLNSVDRLDTSFALLFHMKRDALSALTFHKVQRAGQQAMQIQPGRILSPADEMHILRLLTRPEHERALTILPENTLNAGTDHSLWWVPGAVRPMHLNLAVSGMQSVETHWPNLVMLAINRRIFVAATASNERPEAATPLFHAPIGNVYASSEVCLGDCKPPVNCTVDSIDDWNSVIFDSAFSHSNHPGAMAAGDVMDYWKKKRRKPTPVPAKSMTSMRLTLEEWYERIMTGQAS